jgi:hypothetical protein
MRSDVTTFRKFLINWREAISAPSDLWDGYRAVAELKGAGHPEGEGRRSMITFVRCDPEEKWRPREMLRKVFVEVWDYKRQRVSWAKEFRESELLLAKIERKVALKTVKLNHSSLRRLMSNTAAAIERRRKILSKFINRSPFRSPLGSWENLWPHLTRAEIVRPEVDLDTRLQLQCAKMFRTFLHEDEGVSLRTIARLVVLVYKAAGLASEINKESYLRIADSGRPIKVRAVEEKLRRKPDLLRPRY